MKLLDQGGAPARAELMKPFTNIPVQVKAGAYDVAVTFIERARIESDEFVGFLPGDEFSRGAREPRLLLGVDVMGPFDSPGISDTPSRRRIFVCKPEAGKEAVCARRIAENLARRAFRTGGFDAGIEQMVAAILVSPDFLFRAIRTPESQDRSELALNDLVAKDRPARNGDRSEEIVTLLR